MELSRNTRINLTIGTQCTVIKELGRGGQGIVYLVDVAGKQMALKWYITPPDNNFYKNLQNNIRNGAPSDAFIWPEYLTEKEHGSFGYVMKLRPSNYYEFGNFLLAKKNFKSFQAMVAAAMKICNGFMMLHRFGYSYQDLNDGNFFIEPETGDVLICDNDNVMPQGEKSGIMGKARYMAPEVVVDGKVPDKYSDRFSLSIILFMLFFANHPFEGAKVVACPCMTEAFEKKFYGSEAVFMYDPTNKENLPVRGIHQNVIRRWPVFPKILKDTFIDQFSQEKLKNPQSRMIEQDWEKIIAQVRDQLVRCPICGEETFYDIALPDHTCIDCGRSIKIDNYLELGRRQLLLTVGTKLFIDHDNIADGIVETSPQNDGSLWIKNLSPEKWTVETASGKIKSIDPNGVFPVKPGISVSFSNMTKGVIK